MSISIDPHRHRQLFLDDGAIEAMRGVRRVLHTPERQGPVLKRNASRGEKHVQSNSVPQWNSDGDLWEWWYNGFTTFTEESLSLYAISTDGVNWETPDLGRYEWNGSRSNNIAHDSVERHIGHVIRDEVDRDERRRYKAFFTDAVHMNRYPGVSADGFDWEISTAPPIPSQDTSQMIYDSVGEQYLATVKHRTEWGRSAWLVTSPDFVDWSDPELILTTDEIDQENRRRRIQAVVDDPAYLSPPVVDGREYLAQLYVLPVLPYEGLYVGFPLVFNPCGPDPLQSNHTGLNQVELAVSRDARHWERVANRQVFIGIEPWDGGANFGNAQVALCGPPIAHGNELWFYYLGYRFRGHRDLFRDLDPAIYNDAFFEESSAICLATLRRDGFVSLEAQHGDGEVLTTPFVWTGNHLVLNADAGKGEIRVEVVNADTDETLSGYSAHECVPLREDQLGAEVAWTCSTRPRCGERPVRLKFHLRESRLYSFWLS